MNDPVSIADSAVRFARLHSTGILLCGELIEPVPYILTADGIPVACLPGHTFDAESLTLAIPIDDAAESLQLLVDPTPIDPDSADADRWKIYHGAPPQATFARLDIQVAKFKGQLVDLAQLDLSNPLAPVENTICREMNRDRFDDWLRICTHHCRLHTRRPLLVGVDPLGFDIRAHAGIVRLEAPSKMNSESNVRAVIDQLANQASQQPDPRS